MLFRGVMSTFVCDGMCKKLGLDGARRLPRDDSSSRMIPSPNELALRHYCVPNFLRLHQTAIMGLWMSWCGEKYCIGLGNMPRHGIRLQYPVVADCVRGAYRRRIEMRLGSQARALSCVNFSQWDHCCRL